PAPSPPSRAVVVPRFTAKFTPLTASTRRYDLRRSRTSITAWGNGAMDGGMRRDPSEARTAHLMELYCNSRSAVSWLDCDEYARLGAPSGEISMLKVYGMSISGNCHKVRMVLEALKLPYAWEEIDTREGTTRTPEFLAKNPSGQVPLLEIERGVYLPESNAIIFYLAEGSALLPTDRLERAQVLRW